MNMKMIFKLELMRMKRNDSYNTKQKDLILSVIKKQKHEFTIKDIYNEVKDKTGLTTIYRLVDKLNLEGHLSKYVGEDNTVYYQYLEECNHDDHFYLKCDSCGLLMHIDCSCINDLSNHLFKDHDFILNKKNIVINGLCSSCRKKLN